MRLIDADLLKQDLSRFYEGVMPARDLIDSQPTVEPERKKGKWKCDVGHWIEGERETGEMIDTYACSYCGFYQYWKTPFCPNCGAVMNQDGEQE